MKYQYKKVDAFTKGHSLGNPAACVYLNENETLTPDQMQAIAKAHEHFVCEMAFCKKLQGEEADYEVSYYSSECEVAFCGHGTIASMYSLIQSNPDLLQKETLKIKTKKGILVVYNRILQDEAVFISAPAPKYEKKQITTKKLAEALEIHEDEIDQTLPVEIIDAGLKTLIIPIKRLEKEVEILPDLKQLEQFVRAEDVDIILIYSKETQGKESFMHTRVFAPKFGYLEDPATGSGNSALGYYLLRHHLWKGELIRIEQGNDDGAFNEVCLMAQEQEGEMKVRFGGKAKERIEGVYIVEE